MLRNIFLLKNLLVSGAIVRLFLIFAKTKGVFFAKNFTIAPYPFTIITSTPAMACRFSILAPAIYTLAPAAYTLAPSLYTIAPLLYTITPAAYTITPATCTIAPASYTFRPAAYTIAPASYTIAPADYTYAPALSTKASTLSAIPAGLAIPYLPLLALASMKYFLSCSFIFSML